MAAGDVTQHPAGTCLVVEPVPSPQLPGSKGAQQSNGADQAAAEHANLGSSGAPQRSAKIETATEAAARGLWLPAPEVLGGLSWPWLATHETDWSPERLTPTLNLRLDGRIVPSVAAGGARVSFSHLVVLDGFFGEPERRELAGFLTSSGAAAGQANGNHAAVTVAPDVAGAEEPSGIPERDAVAPGPLWERATADRAGLPPSWGLKEEALRELATARLMAMREVHTRLARLYPDYAIAHMPSSAIQQQGRGNGFSQSCGVDAGDRNPQAAGSAAHDGVARQLRPTNDEALSLEDDQAVCQQDVGEPAAADCDQFVGNAAVWGDCFRWHIDADPAGFPSPSPWTDAFGDYCNGEPGRPLLVSLLLYLDAGWPRDWAAETLFLDDGTDTGIVVRPRPCRAVLMDQDVLHRVSAPSQLAEGRPRFSLVWKLAFLPRSADAVACLARPEWGPSTAFGSAARLEAMQRSVASRKRKASTLRR